VFRSTLRGIEDRVESIEMVGGVERERAEEEELI
jgi:hypothetical protein